MRLSENDENGGELTSPTPAATDTSAATPFSDNSSCCSLRICSSEKSTPPLERQIEQLAISFTIDRDVARNALKINRGDVAEAAEYLEEQQRLEEQQPEEKKVCIICLDEPRTVRFDCGHLLCCFNCSDELQKRGQPCPTCRAAPGVGLFQPIEGPLLPGRQETWADPDSEIENAFDTKDVAARVSALERILTGPTEVRAKAFES